MKSVKLKLFIAYAITIFVILFVLSLASIYFFKTNKKTNSLKQLDLTYIDITKMVETKSDKELKNIDRLTQLNEIFLIIMKNDKILFTNQTNYKTNKILDEIDFEEKYNKHIKFEKHRKKEIEEFYDDYEEDGYIEIDNYIMSVSYMEKENDFYEIYLGVDERYVEKSLEEIYRLIIILNTILFLILSVLGYFLVNKTLKPLKLILNNLKILQNKQDLALRLNPQNSNDEFEILTNTFNEMLNDIEKNVENIKQFSSDVSHELKTPLTIIQGEIELCNRNENDKKQLKQSIFKINKEQKKLQNIIQDFLLLARLDKEIVQNKSALLDKVILDCIELNLPEIEAKNLELQINIDENLEVVFEEKYLFIVINNLLTNSIKYTNKGYIKLSTKKKKDKIIFEISDSGMGIDVKDITNIFERFFRVDKVRTTTKNGVGLGLAIVKKICDRFNCTIDVKSKLDEGSTFQIQMRKR